MPSLHDPSPGDPVLPGAWPACIAFVAPLPYLLAAAAFVAVAIRMENIFATSLFIIAAILSSGAGIVLGIDIRGSPEPDD